MDNLENFHERFEALERRTQMVERRLRWWRGMACGVLILALLSLALPSGKAADAPAGGLAERVATLEDKLAAMAFDAVANEVVITGANLRIVNGLRATPSANGLGNLIVGYNERRNDPNFPDVRNGSHNVVVGTQNNFSLWGGLVVGTFNEISGAWASVCGGSANTASGTGASVSGGMSNLASGGASSVSGGAGNTASGVHSAITRGRANLASGEGASVSGGLLNTASGLFSSVSGGEHNEAIGELSAVSGGENNIARGIESSISGGMGLTQDTGHGWAAGSFGGTISGRFVSP